MIMDTVNIQYMKIDRNKRILVTSDIHGHLEYLEKVLEKAGFNDDDILIIVGDMIEKGPDSLKTLRYVKKLCERGNVIPLIGNVDAWRLHMIHGICAESVPGFFDYLLWLRAYYGTSFFDELTSELGYIVEGPEDILHSKDDFMNSEHCFDKYVVVGHWPVMLYGDKIRQANPVINRTKKIISIDGGCGINKEGQLNLLIIPEINCHVEDIQYVSYDDLPIFYALSQQKETGDSINIRWTNNEIRILERNEEFTYVVHVASDRKLWIPTSYILDDFHCMGYTDYTLPVQIGDKLSLVEETSKGYLVKKGGVVGWYYGKLKK